MRANVILRPSLLIYFILSLSLFLTSCNASKKTKGAVIGATIGGAAGALLSEDNKAVAIIGGAAAGGVAGGLIGNYMDKQAEDIADDLEDVATVTRVGEGIVVSFDSGLLFDFDSYALRKETMKNIDKLAESLIEYDKTIVHVLGHTDNTGSADYNKKLSRQRAQSVEDYLTLQDIEQDRINTKGYGETDPVATNETDEGRQLNRRVEIVIVADEELKEDAKEGNIPE